MGSEFQLPVEGVAFGHAVDPVVNTGTTVCLFSQPAVTALHIMGASPGTRDTELLSPDFTVDEVDAIVLSGGSAFGLDAASGVQAWLREHDRGVLIDPVRIPIVPGAILFDMRNDGNKDWGRYPPYRELGYAATETASATVELGRSGAGYGAATANTPGGFGLASATFAGGHVVAAVALNAVGSPLIGDTHHFWAAPFEEGDEFGGFGLPDPWPANAKIGRTKSGQQVAGANTTLAIVITDLALRAAEAKRIAIATHDGFARALYPVHTPADGDLAFVASTGKHPLAPTDHLELGVIAGNVTARAIARAAYEAIKDAGP
jgi:L-aminopeptidase/D-esterase-like protein